MNLTEAYKQVIEALDNVFELSKSQLDKVCERDKPIIKKSEYINDDRSYDDIADILSNGKAKEHFNVGDKFKVGKYVFDVVKLSDTGMILLSHDLVAQMLFDATEPSNPDKDIANYGSNDYATSAVRQWLNSDREYGGWWKPKTEYDAPIGSKDFINGFMSEIDERFINIITPCENGDEFFLPSEDEIKEWFPNEKDRIKEYASGEKDWYWTRTPYSGNSYSVRCVYTSGTLHYSMAYGAYGVAPACVIGEIKR